MLNTTLEMTQRLCYGTAYTVLKGDRRLSFQTGFRSFSTLSSFSFARNQAIQRCRCQRLTLCIRSDVLECVCPQTIILRYKSDGKDKDLSSLIQPIPVKPVSLSPDDINIGVELSGSLQKDDLLKLLNQFLRRPEVKKLAAENGLDQRLFHQAYLSFRRFCVESEQLPVDIHIVFSDILQQAGHVDDIFPYFIRHAKEIFPHLNCMEDLRKISDIRVPANWYPEARAIQRKIIFHAGPTNSGKTHHALERFLTAKSGVYCGPLKLLASEVFHKSNTAGTPCDLVTGEERRYADPDSNPSTHVSCTVEMTSTTTPYEVGVIDEIQMIRDTQRGWAWSRVLLGLCAHEVHLCGEAAAIDLVQDLMLLTGDEVEVRRYKRLTKLTYLDQAVESFDNFHPGDCVVCFSKNDIYHISRQLERRGKQCAVIYGGLPPGTKLAQAQKFNDPDDPCKIMVATDAIGMGLNLSIKRIIFYTLIKPHLNEKGEKEMDVISTSQALQISGRAGRYGTSFEEGEVTTYKKEDLPLLKDVINRPIELIELAGLHPTAEQIELFAYHLPNATLSNLMDIFVTLCRIDSDKYFMCNVDDFKFLADMIEHVPLALRARYVFCCAPIPKKQPFVCTMFLKFARQYSRAEALTLDWVCRQIGSPFAPPETIMDLVHLEAVFDVLDLYLWLSYRFADQFPDTEHVRYMQSELDALIQTGMLNITRLIVASETSIAGAHSAEDDEFEMKRRITKSTMAKQVHHIDDENTFRQSSHITSRYHGNRSNNRSDRDMREKDDDFSDREFSDDNKDSRTSLSSNFLRAKNRNTNIESIYDSTGERVKPGKGRLTSELIKQGILTPEMLSKLESEWKNNDDSNRHRIPAFRRGRGYKKNNNDDDDS